MTLKARCFEEAAQARKTLRKGNCECARPCESRAVKLEVHEINLRTSAIFFALLLVLIKREKWYGIKDGFSGTTRDIGSSEKIANIINGERILLEFEL